MAMGARSRGISSGLMLFLAVLPAMSMLGCASSGEARRANAQPAPADTLSLDTAVLLDDSSAVAAIRRLESDPLDSAAADLRQHLFIWLVASPNLTDFSSDTPPIDELQNSDFPYREQLLLQYLFGSAAWAVSGVAGDLADQREAGLRSLIAAYRSIVQRQPAKRDAFIDMLDGLRRKGELRSYILQLGKQ